MSALRDFLSRFRGAVDGRQVSLRRLGEALRAGQPEVEQEMVTRQMVASLMLFEALGSQIDAAFDEFEQPLVASMEDATVPLKDRATVYLSAGAGQSDACFRRRWSTPSPMRAN